MKCDNVKRGNEKNAGIESVGADGFEGVHGGYGCGSKNPEGEKFQELQEAKS